MTEQKSTKKVEKTEAPSVTPAAPEKRDEVLAEAVRTQGKSVALPSGLRITTF